MSKQPIVPESKKRYTGEYVAQVIATDDPKQLLRVRVRVFPLFEGIRDTDLPWAEYKLPIGARPGQGIFNPVKAGDWVWVDFPYAGDTRRPRITGSVHFCPGEEPNLSHESWDGPNRFSHQRNGNEPEPTPPDYHDDSIILDENGALLEVRADGSICATQKASGSAIEIAADGSITVHSESEVNISSVGDTNIIVDGKAKVTATGTIEFDGAGGSGTIDGVVQGNCICPLTGTPHIMKSSTTKASL